MQATDTDTAGRVSMCVTRSNQQTIRQLFLIGLIVFVVLSAQCARAADELVPPFGFRWYDSMPRVEAVLHQVRAKITSREKKEKGDVWTVEGLTHPGLKRSLFTFKNRVLVEVELQYEYDRGIEWYNTRMGEIRKYFDEKYGTGKLVSRSRDNDTDVIQTLVGYQWMIPKADGSGTTMLELFYFSAEQGRLPANGDRYPPLRIISVGYKTL